MNITAAVERGDLDELQRLVDDCCEAHDWDALGELRARCARAFERGRQLWPVAAQAEYRLALEAPARDAASVLVEGTGRFALGPLPEVAASAHTWGELAPHVRAGPPAVVALHERVLRGEDCSAGELPGPPVLEMPRRLALWEPSYAVAEYHAHRAHFPAPDLPAIEEVELPPAPTAGTDRASEALAQLAAVWIEGSDGRVDAVAVDGDALEAIAALGVRRARSAAITVADALAQMAWAAASGGAHGRRPGAAAGRFAAWWALASLVDLAGAWPVHPERLGAEGAELEWLTWDAWEPGSGWELRLAVADPRRGRSWAVAAVDAT